MPDMFNPMFQLLFPKQDVLPKVRQYPGDAGDPVLQCLAVAAAPNVAGRRLDGYSGCGPDKASVRRQPG